MQRGAWWIAALVIVACGVRAEEGERPVFKAGAATIDITPPIGLPMWGYGSRRDRPNEGVMDRLEANALVFEVGTDRIALVGLDLGRAPTRKSMARIREQVKKESGVGTVFLVGSHTHHGPVLEIDDLPNPSDSYVRKLEEKIAEVIAEATGKLTPARLGVGRRELTMNRNRHSKLAEKPIDRELAVLRVESTAGKPIALAVNFAAHPTMIDDMVMRYSADYPGALKRKVEKEMGGVCLFLQGAAGDMSANPGSHHGHVAFGTALGEKAVELARSIDPVVPAKPSIKTREEDFQFKNMRLDLKNPVIKAVFIRAFFKRLVDFYIQEYAEGSRPHLTVALVNGELGLVGASGEFFANHSVNLKRRSRLPNTLFFGYCNDYQQYFPTIEGAAEGGYGADPTVSPVEVGAGEIVVNRGLFHLYDLQEKYKFKLF